jgi:hypothetical protein
MEDWLKARLEVPAWAARNLPELLERGVAKELLTRLDAVRLQRVHSFRRQLGDKSGADARQVEAALEFCISVVEKHW